MDNTTTTANDTEKKPNVRLVDIPVTNANEALNLLVTFLN